MVWCLVWDKNLAESLTKRNIPQLVGLFTTTLVTFAKYPRSTVHHQNTDPLTPPVEDKTDDVNSSTPSEFQVGLPTAKSVAGNI